MQNKTLPLAHALLLGLFALPLSATAEPDTADVLAAMKSATTFMSETVAVRGGYVWVVSDDLERRWGEVPARPSQVWLQGGTERDLLAALKRDFAKVAHVKPAASRADSAEMYLVATGFRGGPRDADAETREG